MQGTRTREDEGGRGKTREDEGMERTRTGMERTRAGVVNPRQGPRLSTLCVGDVQRP